jgi:DnaK suppressor protein
MADWSEQRRLLRDELARLRKRLGATGDLGLARSMRDSLRQDDVERLAAIRRALSRLDMGTYDVCEACGRQISTERLAAEPAAQFCIDCQRRVDGLPRLHLRPVEEEVLSPPFLRTDRDRADYTGFDGEDSWQALGRWNKRKAMGNEMDDDPADDSADYAEPVEAVSNEQYRAQLPD